MSVRSFFKDHYGTIGKAALLGALSMSVPLFVGTISWFAAVAVGAPMILGTVAFVGVSTALAMTAFSKLMKPHMNLETESGCVFAATSVLSALVAGAVSTVYLTDKLHDAFHPAAQRNTSITAPVLDTAKPQLAQQLAPALKLVRG